VDWLVIVGDAFSRPILGALDEHRGRWDLSSLVGIISSGVMWSEEAKKGLLAHHPSMMLMDAFSSSEALGMGSSVSSGSSAVHTAAFTLGADVRVLGPGGHEVKPGSGQIGVLAIGGRNPLGYYKDEAKTNETFRTYDGIRYSVPGDYATVGEDGKIQLLGRGSVVINTGGDKVFPEEVEEVVKSFPGVVDAVVVGIPNERFGEEVVADVELGHGTEATVATAEQIKAHGRERLAAYKVPRQVRFVDSIGRSPSGKVDYKRHQDEAAAWAALDT
jgi:3-oxocholest-4-en-26-oate---CoA ligase